MIDRRRGLRAFAIALALLSGLVVVARAATPRAAILGTWKRTSTCVKNPDYPACHDEVVVYEFNASAKGGDAATVEAFKIVDGEKQSMRSGRSSCAATRSRALSSICPRSTSSVTSP